MLCSRKASARARNTAGLTRLASNVRSRQMMTSLLMLRRCSAALCLIRSYSSSGMLLTVMLGMATPPRPIMEPFWNHRNGLASFCQVPNAQAELRAEGHAFMPTAQDFLHPWQSKKREPKEPSASTDCWTAVKPKDYLLLIFASCVESLK